MVHLVKGFLLWAVAKYDGYVTNFLFFLLGECEVSVSTQNKSYSLEI